VSETPSEAAADCELVVVTEDDPEHVVTVTIDRPDARNALNAQVRAELKRVCDTIDDSDARAVVLTGAEES
jgi:enoyl-CoA hydratase